MEHCKRGSSLLPLHCLPLSGIKLLLLALLVGLLLTPALAYDCNGVPESECDALYALYYSTNGDGWTDKSGWLTTEPVWNWYGIEFSAGHVVEIFLWNNGLSGTIPAELENLPKLRSLVLSGALTGSIPPELGNLTNLLQLSLSGPNLSGDIPPELGNLTNLINLSLGGRISGELPPELGNLANLQSLNLGGNDISGPIPSELGNLTSLRNFILYENNLSGPIPPELGNLTGIDDLVLRNNQLSGPIPPELGNLTGLGLIDFSRNRLTGEIPPEFGNLALLYSLNLSFNNLSGPVPEELGNLPYLGGLHLNSNNLNGDLPAWLANPPAVDPEGESPPADQIWFDLRYNRLYATNGSVRTFMETEHHGEFLSTQTLPPENVTAETVVDSGNPENRVKVSWDPIDYLDDPGGYQVFYSREGEEDYYYGGMAKDKLTTEIVIPGLEPGGDYDFVVKSVTWNHGWNGNSLYSEDSSTASASAGTLHRAFIPLWKQSPDYFTGVVASNFGDTAFDLTLTAWDENGNKEPLGTNPATFNIDPDRQESLVGVEFFDGNPANNDFSWIELSVENSRSLGSIFLFGASDTSLLDGAEAQVIYHKKLYFTRPFDELFFAGRDADIQLYIVNPTDEAVDLVCWMRGTDRQFGKSYTIPPRGFIRGTAKDLVPNYYDLVKGYMEIDVTDGPGVIGFSRIEFPGPKTALGLNAVEAHQSEKMYSAQLAHGAGIVTNLQLVNTNAGLRNVKLSAIADDGSLLAAPVWVALLPKKAYNADLGTLFKLNPGDGILTGSLVVESFGRGVIGDIIFAEGDTLEYAMSLPLQHQLFREAVFNHISNLSTVFTGFAFFNPGDETAAVTIEAVGVDGEQVAEITLALGPGERIARTLTDSDIWPDFPEQSGGYIRISSDQPIAGQQLFGDRSLRYMAAVPPTTVP